MSARSFGSPALIWGWGRCANLDVDEAARSQVPGPSKLAHRRGQPFGPVVGRDEVAPQNARARHRSFLLDLDPDRWRQFQSQSQSQLTPINQPAPPCQLPLCGEAAESRISIHLSLSLFLSVSLCLVLSCLVSLLPCLPVLSPCLLTLFVV